MLFSDGVSPSGSSGGVPSSPSGSSGGVSPSGISPLGSSGGVPPSDMFGGVPFPGPMAELLLPLMLE